MNKKDVKQVLISQREQMQEDLLCRLDGMDERTLDAVCQMVVDRFRVIAKLLDIEL